MRCQSPNNSSWHLLLHVVWINNPRLDLDLILWKCDFSSVEMSTSTWILFIVINIRWYSVWMQQSTLYQKFILYFFIHLLVRFICYSFYLFLLLFLLFINSLIIGYILYNFSCLFIHCYYSFISSERALYLFYRKRSWTQLFLGY